MKWSTLLFLLGSMLGVYMFVVGILYYQLKMKINVNKVMDSRRLTDKIGYAKFYGKHMMTFGAVMIGSTIVQFISLIWTQLDFIFAIYSVFLLVMAYRMVYCLCCKTDQFFETHI